MGTMKFEVPHTLSKDEAKQRVEALTRYWQSKYGVSSQWQGDGATINGRVMGIKLEASFQVTDAGIAGEGTDPGMLFRSKAKEYLNHKFRSFLDPKKSLEDLKRSDD